MMTQADKRIGILISFSGQGGVERMVTNLARGFLAQGFAVDMLLIKAKGEHLANIPRQVNVIKLKAQHNITCLPEITAYLKHTPPQALLVAKHRAIRMAVIARYLAGSRVRLVGRLGTTVSGALSGQSWLRKALWHWDMRFFYRWVDKLIAVSDGVRDDVLTITGLAPERVVVANNPVVVPEIMDKAQQPPPHQWLVNKEFPVIVAAGRFTRQKDFATLLDALAIVNQTRSCRLIILGEGKLRADLESQVERLGLQQQVAMPGFTDNPYAYMARSDLFVLSSRWEGSPNVLKEALSLGIPVVATDCPSGPRQILRDGKFGPLVAMGDAPALAQAVVQVLDAPLPAQTLRQAVQDYTLEASSAAYLKILNMV